MNKHRALVMTSMGINDEPSGNHSARDGHPAYDRAIRSEVAVTLERFIPGDIANVFDFVAAQEVIAEKGVENLSLRDVARRLGFSHQAPYKHYPRRDHLLVEVMRRCFQSFAEHLDARGQFDDPKEDLAALGRQYLSYARDHALEYRLMLDTPWPESAEHPDLIRDATHTYDILRKVLRRLHGESAALDDRVDLDASYIWSTVHGLAGVMNGNCIDKLNLKPKALAQAIEDVIKRVELGLLAKQ